jgi:hypothetical protein
MKRASNDVLLEIFGHLKVLVLYHRIRCSGMQAREVWLKHACEGIRHGKNINLRKHNIKKYHFAYRSLSLDLIVHLVPDW